jgi:O-antigen chain-terminating methyltransferase
LEAQIAALRDELGRAHERANGFEHALGSWRDETVVRFETDERTLREEAASLRMQLLVHERTLRDAAAGGATAAPAADDDGSFDPLLAAFYSAFEDRFRGSREEIKRRASVYLPVVRDAGAGVAERPIVDVGCGRGEWLELLADEQLVARGIDSNLVMVEQGRARGLVVDHADVFAGLRGLPDASVGAVTAFHLIEHLPFARLVAVVDEIVRVLQPGGVVVLETPNPTNLVVGASSFFIDPTHRTPLHPETMRFLAESRGLVRVEIRPLHPADERRLPDDGGVATRVNEHLYGPQDYAVVGYRS